MQNGNNYITMLGTGNALATRCYNTCFTLHGKDGVLLVDAGGGNGILAQLEKAGIRREDISDLFVTHARPFTCTKTANDSNPTKSITARCSMLLAWQMNLTSRTLSFITQRTVHLTLAANVTQQRQRQLSAVVSLCRTIWKELFCN